MDVTAIEYGAVIEAVDPLLADVLAWADELDTDDRYDPEWLYSFADLVRALERYRRGQP